MRRTIGLPVLVAVFGVVGCRDQAGLEPAPGTVLVDIRETGFEPETVRVAVGQAVRWTNRSQQAHGVSSADFDSGNLFPTWWFEAKFEAAGTINYACPLHETETGTIVIE